MSWAETTKVSRVKFAGGTLLCGRGETSESDLAQRITVAMACFRQAIDSGSAEKKFEFHGPLCSLRSSASPVVVAQRSLRSVYAAVVGGEGHHRSGSEEFRPVFAGHRPFGIKLLGRLHFNRVIRGLQTLPLIAARRRLPYPMGLWWTKGRRWFTAAVILRFNSCSVWYSMACFYRASTLHNHCNSGSVGHRL
jgi:hypothetical protein